ncbi:Imm52 family immunity protein [Actinoplanes sp. DH11]|uniref:Imm52 family immunity protein n=1 Tax=Actinoplanes sp. DH11 TaxID=2857011 RepID=UPI001E39DEFB|nr:Imm52 family immunity protein [Actinoplanes sp. DH11]
MTVESISVQVLWGPRPEDADALAARWRATRLALAGLHPLLGAWFVHDGETDVPVADEPEESLVADGDLGGGAGFRFAAYAGQDAPQQIHFNGTGGLRAPLTGQLNVALVKLEPVTTDEFRAWLPLLGDILAALAQAWRPDVGHAGTFRMRQAQRPAPREPWTGYVTYLCRARTAHVPADLAGTGRPAAGGGLILPAATSPDAVDLGRRLRDAGAFEPVPADREHWSPG